MSASTDILSSEKPLPCPSCKQLFRLPEGFTARNALACPHCNEEVTGQEILDTVAPTARIIDSGPDAPLDVSVEPTNEKSQKPVRQARSFDEQDFVIPKPLKTATRRSRSRHPERKGSRKRSSRKKKKKEANAGKEFIKIAFGGLLALPIAQLVLWWGLNSDPLNLAGPTSSIASFVVPPKLRPIVIPEEETEEKRNKDMPKNQKLNDHNLPLRLPPR